MGNRCAIAEGGVAARTAIFVFSNRQRLHPALAYQPPAAFEEEMLLLSDRAA